MTMAEHGGQTGRCKTSAPRLLVQPCGESLLRVYTRFASGIPLPEKRKHFTGSHDDAADGAAV